uniref:Rho guanine nucleotide exchange factor (GEF) 1b n=1 Tax=Sinocyclocheilus rhinocerous TaxID=307959 RepID=A0A673JR30_9TELE
MVDDQCSHFNSIELLKSRPTHLLVFIHHVMLQFDCAPVLCYLHADLFKNFNAKDTKKHFGEFYNNFLEKGAVYRMRPEMINEEQQKRFAYEIQFMQSPEILRQLDDFSVEGGLLPDGLVTGPVFGPFPQQEEMEPRLLELEQDPPNWRALASPEDLRKLSKKEIKRQEVINELFTTEHAHVRMLSVLQTVFSRPLEREEIITVTELATIFPSLDEIIEMHCMYPLQIYYYTEICMVLIDFDEGEWFQKLTARFCSYQSWALEQIKSRQKKDPRFNAFILEAESKPQCRRLQLKDIIPIEMQRLTKYPLLLENIAKNTDDEAEKENINQAAESCRKILNHVNEEVKLMENLLILKDYQRRLDTSGLKPSNDLYSEYKNIDLTTRIMLFEGPLTWRVTKEKAIDVHCVLLSDMLVLLQKQDDKMVLKCQSKSNIAIQEGKQMLSPIIKLESVFLRDVATDPKALYVIFTWDSGAQIYELVAQSIGERKKFNLTFNHKVQLCSLLTKPFRNVKNGHKLLIDIEIRNAFFSFSVEESSTEGRTEEESGGDGGNKGEEERGISAPLVLSEERMEEVQRRLQTLGEQLKRLQARRTQILL